MRMEKPISRIFSFHYRINYYKNSARETMKTSLISGRVYLGLGLFNINALLNILFFGPFLILNTGPGRGSYGEVGGVGGGGGGGGGCGGGRLEERESGFLTNNALLLSSLYSHGQI